MECHEGPVASILLQSHASMAGAWHQCLPGLMLLNGSDYHTFQGTQARAGLWLSPRWFLLCLITASEFGEACRRGS